MKNQSDIKDIPEELNKIIAVQLESAIKSDIQGGLYGS